MDQGLVYVEQTDDLGILVDLLGLETPGVSGAIDPFVDLCGTLGNDRMLRPEALQDLAGAVGPILERLQLRRAERTLACG